MLLVSFSQLTFFNISTANDACLPSTTFSQAFYLMSSCSFSSICDAYDGGIVPSLNNPLVSLTVSNTSFTGCCRKRNIECNGTSNNKKQPRRHNVTDNGPNTFTWCEWNGSKATGTSDSVSDGVSSGGAICMYNLNSGELSVSYCSFNDCTAHYHGGAVMCYTIKAATIESSSFNCCASSNRYGGGVYLYDISTCARVSGCEFKNCQAIGYGGGLKLEYFNVSEGCIGTESGEVESACVFDCSFTSCSVTNYYGGGMYCKTVPTTQFKMRSIQFVSCSATANGGGLELYPNRATTPNDRIYCYFLFFHGCKCLANVPYGHDAYYVDYYNVFLNSDNPFYECYTTNTNEQRVCYAYNYSNAGAWTYDQSMKKDWLKDKTLYVSMNGNDSYELCGANETNPCLTVKKAFEMCEVQISLTITLMEGDHTSEATTIEIGEKKILVIGKGRTENFGCMSCSSASEAEIGIKQQFWSRREAMLLSVTLAAETEQMDFAGINERHFERRKKKKIFSEVFDSNECEWNMERRQKMEMGEKEIIKEIDEDECWKTVSDQWNRGEKMLFHF
ncbi:uncharacterized protein MONOS_13995 [Monocercomonoides exilis]|uniref:uncharacterized protein n=1 Tax=Monocercomonoides exilis TaxID=2049356 RepID=UPI003559D58D|nr:hypothetical protein MONOS_13995 [Monocercomonoides exilis]|eukprot:MONOS_13995.1-p1 / transcript=MONOS_13995.1 / gene=MONOS_13995 / organism=Monocercomonoides_exilis_PA203 / gene_product=unspecified product / transcript_product=unspecified product / location=Mono_scaffold00918:20378-22303(+) / protein_length=561 / sequence_SO=supercontig / SO=protein_coding / is_pseudo=false